MDILGVLGFIIYIVFKAWEESAKKKKRQEEDFDFDWEDVEPEKPRPLQVETGEEGMAFESEGYAVEGNSSMAYTPMDSEEGLAAGEEGIQEGTEGIASEGMTSEGITTEQITTEGTTTEVISPEGFKETNTDNLQRKTGLPFTQDEVVRGFVWAEILQPPKAKRVGEGHEKMRYCYRRN
ncbi:hypothetical protein RDV78_02885 [Bacillota bacterium LX-D]|nr:hypothetical protein [Bacillota bacterium LX-D]